MSSMSCAHHVCMNRSFYACLAVFSTENKYHLYRYLLTTVFINTKFIVADMYDTRLLALRKIVKLAKKTDCTREELLYILNKAQFDNVSTESLEKHYFSATRNRSSEAFAEEAMSGRSSSRSSSQSSRSAQALPFSSFRCSMAVKGYFHIRRVVLDYDRVIPFIAVRLRVTSDALEAFLIAEAHVLQMLRGCFMFHKDVIS